MHNNIYIDNWQDARFALDKDEQTTFIDSQGKLNPKAVKWSEVKITLDFENDMAHVTDVF